MYIQLHVSVFFASASTAVAHERRFQVSVRSIWIPARPFLICFVLPFTTAAADPPALIQCWCCYPRVPHLLLEFEPHLSLRCYMVRLESCATTSLPHRATKSAFPILLPGPFCPQAKRLCHPYFLLSWRAFRICPCVALIRVASCNSLSVHHASPSSFKFVGAPQNLARCFTDQGVVVPFTSPSLFLSFCLRAEYACPSKCLALQYPPTM